MYRVVIPADCEARHDIPKGAALLDIGEGLAFSCFERQKSVATLCQEAVDGKGKTVTLDCETVLVGTYDDTSGRLSLSSRIEPASLQTWYG